MTIKERNNTNKIKTISLFLEQEVWILGQLWQEHISYSQMI